MQITTDAPNDTITFTNSSPNVDQNIFATVSGDSGSTTANTTTDTSKGVTINRGSSRMLLQPTSLTLDLF